MIGISKRFQFCFGVAILSIMAIWSIFSVIKISQSVTLQDFSVYFAAAKDLQQSISPYRNQNYYYVYPPSSFFILLPLFFLPYQLALPIWTISSVIALWAAIYLFLVTLKSEKIYQKSLILLIFALCAFPTKFSLGMGQANIWVLFLTVLAFFYEQKSQQILSGISLGLAAAIKIFPLFFLLLFIYQKRWRSVGSCLTTFIFLQLLPALFLGPTVITDFFAQRLWSVGGVQNAVYFNQALSGLLSRLGGSANLNLILITIGFILLMTRAWRVKETTQQFSILICIWLMIQSVSWQHYFVFLVIPFTFLAEQIFFAKAKPNWQKGLLILIYLLAAVNIRGTANFGLLNPFFYSHLFLATLGIYFWLLKIRLESVET